MFPGPSSWQLLLWAVAALLAVGALTELMGRRQAELSRQLRRDFNAEQDRKRAAWKKERATRSGRSRNASS